MPPKKRPSIGRVTNKAKKQALDRANERCEKTKTRLENNRIRNSNRRETETLEQSQARLENDRVRNSIRRETETLEQSQARLENDRIRNSNRRETETLEQSQARHEDKRVRKSNRRETETLEQSQARLADKRVRESIRRETETLEQSQARLENVRVRTSNRRSNEWLQDLKRAAHNYNPRISYHHHKNVTIGELELICPHCSAYKWKGEPPGMCCSNGKVKLQPLQHPPDPLANLLKGESQMSRHFLDNIRKYNSCFQMTSFGAQKEIREQGFMPTFKVQGQIYHRAGSLLPFDGEPQFLQIYFMGDTAKEVQKRCANFQNVNQSIVLELQDFLHSNNAYVQLFKTALERMPTDEYKVVIRADKAPRNEHQRRFNAPTFDEVAIVMVGNEFDRRDIVLQKRNSLLQRVAETHRSYDALQYPIMFWQGDDGYYFGIPQINPDTGNPIAGKKVSAMDYYSYRIMMRVDEENHLLKCRQLFHQFIVDMFAKIESERLLYIRLNQKKLRVDDYIHLRDAVANDANPNDLGKMVILPATFTGSPRHMHEYTQG